MQSRRSLSPLGHGVELGVSAPVSRPPEAVPTPRDSPQCRLAPPLPSPRGSDAQSGSCPGRTWRQVAWGALSLQAVTAGGTGATQLGLRAVPPRRACRQPLAHGACPLPPSGSCCVTARVTRGHTQRWKSNVTAEHGASGCPVSTGPVKNHPGRTRPSPPSTRGLGANRGQGPCVTAEETAAPRGSARGDVPALPGGRLRHARDCSEADRQQAHGLPTPLVTRVRAAPRVTQELPRESGVGGRHVRPGVGGVGPAGRPRRSRAWGSGVAACPRAEDGRGPGRPAQRSECSRLRLT